MQNPSKHCGASFALRRAQGDTAFDSFMLTTLRANYKKLLSC
jgi:hypothetical protein